MADNRTHFVVDAQQFLSSDETLFIWESFEVLTHQQNKGDAEQAVLTQWNEDGVLADFRFSVDNTKNVSIQTIDLALVASDGTTTFELDRLSVNLSPNTNIPPVINVNSERGYILPASDDFNLLELVDGGTVSTKTFYEGAIGQKITWQEWIANANVAAVFTDITQQNNGLNQKADNYSNASGYSIYLKGIATVTGTDSVQGVVSRTYEILSNNINVYDYDESDDGTFTSATIETFDSTGTYNLGGGFLPDEDTLMQVTWVGAAPLVLADIGYVAHRIEREDAPGNLEIEEISSLRGQVTGGKLENISVVQSGSDIVSTCIIKAGSLSAGTWKLSARIESPPLDTTQGWILIHMTNPNGLATVFEARNNIFQNNKTFTSVNSATVATDYSFKIGDTGTDLDDANAARWGTFSALTWAQFVTSSIDASERVRIEYTGAVTDADILAAIEVGVNENEIATVTNTIYAADKIAIFDVMMPFQTDNDINSVVEDYTGNQYDAVRTDAEVSAGQDLTDFVSGIAQLVNLNADASGHYLFRPLGVNLIGEIDINTTAATASEGTPVGFATPLPNLYYPIVSTGINPKAWENDLINDELVATDATFAQYWDYNTVADDDYIIIQATYRPNNTNTFQLVCGTSDAVGTGSVATALYHSSSQNTFKFGIFTGAGNLGIIMNATHTRIIANVYTITFCARKNTNATGGFATKWHIADSFAVINGFYVPVTGASSTTAVYTPGGTIDTVGFATGLTTVQSSVGIIHHAAVKVQNTAVPLSECREYALGGRPSMPYSYEFGAYTSPNNFANVGTVVGASNAIATNHSGVLSDLFI